MCPYSFLGSVFSLGLGPLVLSGSCWCLLIAFLPGILVQCDASCLLLEADQIGACLSQCPLLDLIVYAVSQVPSLPSTPVVPEILGPDRYQIVIVFPLPFLSQALAVSCETVKRV